MPGRIERGTAAMQMGGRVFRNQPALGVFPLLSLLVVGGAYGLLALLVLHFGLLGDVFTNKLLQYGAMFLALSISSLCGIFFNAAVVACTARYFRGEPVSVRAGLRDAWAVRWTVLKWGLISASIGTVLFILEDNLPGFGSLVRAVLNVAWGLLTFFIVPVIVVERVDAVRPGLRQSGETFRRTWGESVTAELGIALVMLPVAFGGIVLLGAAFLLASGPAAIALGVLGSVLLVATVVVTQVLGMVVRTALYHYATTDEPVDLVDELGHYDVFPES